jgi:hypothetical protein
MILYRHGGEIRATTTIQGREVTWEPISSDGLLATVRNVELCMAGIEYPLASGPKTFTPDDLVEAVASQNDPAVQSPRVWLGHPDDQRFHAGRTTPVGSAEPALGKVINMRVEDNGMTLVGDIAGCPTWLAKILSSAYPSRSIEGLVEAETVTGHTWGLLITDLALLGVTWPGVSTLEDLQALYSEDGPEGVEVEEESMAVAAARGAVRAQINDDDIRRQFYAALPDMDLDSWSWIRAQLRDPDELIVDPDDGSGDLYKVSYEIKGEAVEFGDPQKVKVTYVNASQKRDPNARTLLVNYFTAGRKVVASWDTAGESRPDTTNQEGASVNPELIKILRARHGLTEEQLPDDATEDQVLQAMRDDVADPSTQNLVTDPAPSPSAPAVQTTTHAPVTTMPGADPQSPPASPDQLPQGDSLLREKTTQASSGQQPQLPDGYVAVPASAWTEVQANAKAGAQVAQSTEKQRREGVIAAAIQRGRIARHQAGNFRTMYERDPQGAETLLTASVDKGGLMDGTIPVGIEAGVDFSDTTQDTSAYPTEWLPEIQAQHGGQPMPGAPSTVVMEA